MCTSIRTNMLLHLNGGKLKVLLSNLVQLEKEALAKGTPIGQALDIEIPPPRPKRKPCNPYPRKMSIGLPTSQVESKDGKFDQEKGVLN